MNVDETKIEQLDADEARIAELLAGLKRVEAPANFEFRLKAKLANAERPQPRTRFIPAFVRYSAPLAVMAVVGTAFYLNSPTSPDAPVVQTAGVVPQIEKVQEVAAAPAVPGPVKVEDQTPARTRVPSINASLRKPVEPRGTQANSPEKAANGQGSTVRTLNQPKIFLPRGLDASVPANVTPEDAGVKKLFTAGDVLPELGIDAGYSEAGYTVKSVKSNSPAERAGVKAGDLLEAIDENRLVKGTVFKGDFNGRTIKVRRDGKLVELSLKDK